MAAAIEYNALIIQPGAIGDSILTLPLVRLIRRQAYIRHVDVMGHLDHIGFWETRSDIDHAISMDSISLHPLFTHSDRFDRRQAAAVMPFFRKYQLVVTFLYDEEGHFEQNLILASAATHILQIIPLELKPRPDYPHHTSRFFAENYLKHFPGSEIQIDDHLFSPPLIRPHAGDRLLGETLLRKHRLRPEEPLVFIHPGSGGREKCWPIEHFLSFARRLAEADQKPVFLLGPVELERFAPADMERIERQYPVFKNLPLDHLTALLACGKGYLGNDSGITHLAAAINLPGIALFGPTNPIHWRPLGSAFQCIHIPGDWPNPDQLWQLWQERLERPL